MRFRIIRDVRKVSILPVVGLLAALFMALPGGNSGEKVTLRESVFAPARKHVQVGETVWFDNRSRNTHTATCRNCPRDTGDIQPGLAKPLTFHKEGVFVLLCRYHGEAGMVVEITVGEPTTSPAPIPS